MDKVLITGGAGFIGYHLAKRLIENGYQVHIMDNLSRGILDTELDDLSKNDKIKVIEIDLLDIRQLEKYDKDYNFIFHFAAIIGVQHVINRPYDVLNNNVLLLSNIISFAHMQKNLKRFVFASTSEIYAGTLENFTLEIPTPENAILSVANIKNNRTSYMLSKIYGEAMCIHSKLSYTIVRPHNIYGPRMGMSHVIPELLKKAYYTEDQGKIDVYSRNHTRAFCYIDNATEMLRLIIENKKCANEIYNLGNENEELSMEEIARIVLQVVGKKSEINFYESVSNSPQRRCPKMGKLLSTVGDITFINIFEGIVKTYKWYKDSVFLGNKSTAI